jgi:hypothetical protein
VSWSTIFSRTNKRWLLATSVVVVTLLGVGIFLRLQKPPEQPAPQVASAQRPSEEKIDGKEYKWSGAPDEPKYISLPTIKAGGFIQKIGVDKNKEMGVPDNIHLAGWFKDGAKPGQKGLSIIDGHVGASKDNAIFKNLLQLKANEEYTVEFGDGSHKRFRVKEITSVDTAKAASILFSQDPKTKSQLNLITCGGKYDAKSNQFAQRVIVASALIE